MGLTLNKVHEYQKVPGKMESRLIRENHYVRIVVAGLPPIYCQNGVFYSEGDQVLPRETLPEAYWIQARLVTSVMRKLVGLVLPEELRAPAEPVVAAPQPAIDENMRTCGLCQAIVPAKTYGAHIMRHRKRDRAKLEE